MRKTGLTLKEITVEANGFRYVTHRISGTMPDGERIRKQFNDRAEAVQELARLNVSAANTGEVRPVITRLSTDQLAEAEAAFRRLGPDKRLTEAVEWYVANYRPAVVAKTISEADTAFRASKEGHVRQVVIRDYKRVLRGLAEAFPPTSRPESIFAAHPVYDRDRYGAPRFRFCSRHNRHRVYIWWHNHYASRHIRDYATA